MDGLDNAGGAGDEDVAAAWALLEALSTQPREKPADANAGAELIAEHLRAAGLPVTMHAPELYLSAPVRAAVRAGGATFFAKPPAFAASRPGGVSGPLLHIPQAGGGGPLEAGPGGAPAAARGRIVVIEGFALPNFTAGLEAAGAAAVVAVNPGARVHWGTVSTIWGTPEPEDLARLPQIPSAAVNRADGERLIALAREGAEATVETELETGWFSQRLPVVEIPGAVEPEKFVLLHGHHDAWDVGVGDNGAGDACMLAVARRLWRDRARLRRSVRIAWWPGHSLGRYGGSAWFADAFALDLDANCVVHINCDSPGCRDAVSYRSIGLTSETEAAVKQIVRAVAGQETAGKRQQRNSDYSFYNIGLSGCFAASSMITEETRAAKGYYAVGGCGGDIAWHTEDDLMDVADRAVFARDVDLYETAVRAFAEPELLPLDWGATAAEFRATVAAYADAAGDLADLGPAAEAVEAFDAAWRNFREAVEAGRIAPAAANAAMMAAARALIPINHTRGPRFTHDPALNTPPLPAIEPAVRLAARPAEELGFARAQLLRGVNRVAASLRRAREALAGAATGG